MFKNIVLAIAAIFTVVTYAEPMKMGSKSELSAAKSAADGLLKSGVSADEVMKYAEEAKKSAEKYQLYCAAFKLYAKEEKAEEAAKVITTIQAEFIGAPDKDIVSMIEQYGKKLAKDNAELSAALTTSKARVSASQQLSKAKKDLKKNPNSVELKYLIAESHAVLGDWKAALKQFKDAGGSVWQIANEEASGVISAKTAAFWWDYKPRSKFNAEPAFKAHSAALYEKLLNNGELSVLEKATAEKRIEQASSIGATKPKSELDKLKMICNTKGLVHCWRFNGDLKDCVSGSLAIANGSVAITPTQVNLTGNRGVVSHIDLGVFGLPLNDTPFTIEIWASNNEIRNFSRVFTFGDDCVLGQITQSWTRYMDINTERFNKEGSELINNQLSPFELGTEYHLAFVFVPNNQLLVKRYKQDAATGATLASNEHLFSFNMIFTNPRMWLGHTSSVRDDDACASYNEVRIWNRALSEEELTQNAIKFHKAGETMKK